MKCLNHCIRIDQKLLIINGKFERKIFFVYIGHVKSNIPEQYPQEQGTQKIETTNLSHERDWGQWCHPTDQSKQVSQQKIYA